MSEITSPVKNIYQSLAAINREVETIEKARKNQQQGFNFRGIDDVMNSLHPLFAKHGVIILTTKLITVTREERQTKNGGTMTYSVIDYEFCFIAEDGTMVTSWSRGEAADSGDKGTTKCESIALRTKLLNMFLIPTEEEKDRDAGSPEFKAKTQGSGRPAPASPAPPVKLAENVIDAWQSKVNGCNTPEDFTRLSAEMAAVESAAVKSFVKAAFATRMTEMKVSYNKETKSFEQA